MYPNMTRELGTRLDELLIHYEGCGRCKRPDGSHAPSCILATDHVARLAEYWRNRQAGAR